MKPKILDIIANKAEDSSVLHITGNEDVEGTKNFNTAPQISGSNTAKDSDVVHKSGDTMTGTLTMKGYIKMDSNDVIASNVDDNHMVIIGGTAENWNSNSLLNLYGKDHDDSAGEFVLTANNGTNYSYLQGKPSGSLTWGGQELPVPVGTIILSASPIATTNVTGYLYCSGGAVSRTTYSRLFSAIGTTYGEGDGSTTFNIPNMMDHRFIECANGDKTPSTAYKDAGLPNITGNIYFSGNSIMDSDGAYQIASYSVNYEWLQKMTSPINGYLNNLNASRCSSIYGNSTTVQPKSILVFAYIKY